MSLKDRIIEKFVFSKQGSYPESSSAVDEELKMADNNEFKAEAAQSFMDRLRDGKYEIDEGYGGDNLLERIMGGGSPLAPYSHGANPLKGPKAKMGKPAGATWDYNPVDVRPDVKHRNPAPSKSGIEKTSPTPNGVPVDVRPDDQKKMPRWRLRSDTQDSPTKKGWPGTRTEQSGESANLLESIDATVAAIFG